MVSSIRLKNAILVIVVLVLALFALYWVRHALHRTFDRSAFEKLPEVMPDEIPRHPTLEALEPFPGKPIAKEKENELKEFFAQITDAYTNRNYEIVRKQIANVPETLYGVTRQVYQDAITPFCSAFMDEVLWKSGGFLKNRPLPAFENAQELSTYLRVNTDVALFLGRTFIERREWRHPLDILESAALMQLGRYRRMYLHEGENDHVEVVDRFTREWQQHIESEDGFMRQYMWHVVDIYVYHREHREMSWRRYRLDTWQSKGQIFQIARGEATGLIEYGCTPRWLDEFYDDDYLTREKTYPEIEEAYTNNQVVAMKRAMTRVSNRHGSDYRRPFLKMDEHLIKLFKRNFIESGKIKQFDSLEACTRFMLANVEMALFLCGCEYKRGTGGVDFEMGEVECGTYMALRKYAEEFHNEGKSDFEAVVQKCLDTWIAHIDSNQAFLRGLTFYYKAYNPGIRDGLPPAVNKLISNGCTPKWVDEFNDFK